MPLMDPVLRDLLLERLEASELDEEARRVIVALADVGAPTPTATAPPVWLRSVTVEGFRGIGPAATLQLEPGPGLTVVVGRNGSGKSSFAEGLELLLTGENSRWVHRTSVWKEGWQNLHHDGPTRLEATLYVDGEPGLLRLVRTWERGAAVSPGECAVTRGDGSPATLDGLGWPAALARYRPFLSYNELGSMFDELKTMYDALAAILGLEDVDELLRIVRDARLERERALKTARAEAKALVDRLDGVDDDRVRGVVAALRAKPVDLDAIELALEGVGDHADPAGELAALRQLASLSVPGAAQVQEAFDGLEAAQVELAGLAGTDAARAASLAALL